MKQLWNKISQVCGLGAMAAAMVMTPNVAKAMTVPTEWCCSCDCEDHQDDLLYPIAGNPDTSFQDVTANQAACTAEEGGNCKGYDKDGNPGVGYLINCYATKVAKGTCGLESAQSQSD